MAKYNDGLLASAGTSNHDIVYIGHTVDNGMAWIEISHSYRW